MYKITAAFLLLVLLAVNGESEEDQNALQLKKLCPSGWKKFEEQCYKLFKIKKQWNEAEKQCLKSKGHLASVHKPAINFFLKNLVQKQVQRIWIGGHYAAKKAAWTWSDGKNFGYTNWSVKPVGARKNKTCVLAAANNGKLHWKAESCTTRLSFVCYKMGFKATIN